MYHIYDEHAERLPFVRIKKINLTNFKGVKSGCLVFNCAKEFVPFNTKADILGLYGQNGSGKSSVVEALYLLKGILGGYRISPSFTRFIDVSSSSATINVEFDFQYRSGVCATVIYEANLYARERTKSEIEEDDFDEEKVLCISNEVIKTTMYDDRLSRLHTIVNTKEGLICGAASEKYYYDRNDEESVEELNYLKRKTHEDSSSFVFSESVADVLGKTNKEGECSKYYEILAELQLYAREYLYVIGTTSLGAVQIGAGIPIFLPHRSRPLFINEKHPIPKHLYSYVNHSLSRMNAVISTIIPDLQLKVEATPTKMKNGEDGEYLKIFSVRGNKEFPLSYESDGIIRLISILSDYMLAFNDGSTTLVVDEFDSGVFEYLLGELLQIFEESGKGQFLFTSHNLRPLEVLDKKFISFTTSDPNNRYCKLKNVGSTNNLRDLYLRQVQLGGEDVEIYRRTKPFKIAKAIRSVKEDLSIDE